MDNHLIIIPVTPSYLEHCIFISEKTMEGWVGRKRDDSTEISKKSISSHVARMTGGKLILLL